MSSQKLPTQTKSPVLPSGLWGIYRQAVADAYGWGEEWRAGMSDDDILSRLFALNQARAATQA